MWHLASPMEPSRESLRVYFMMGASQLQGGDGFEKSTWIYRPADNGNTPQQTGAHRMPVLATLFMAPSAVTTDGVPWILQ